MAEEKVTTVVEKATVEKKAPAKKAAEKPAAEKKPAAKKPAVKKAVGETAAKKAPAKKAVDAASPAEKKAPAKKAVDAAVPAEKKAPAQKASVKKTAATGSVTIKLVKSLIGRSVKQIATAKSLGLKRVGDVTVQPENAATTGKIVIISHMVTVTKA